MLCQLHIQLLLEHALQAHRETPIKHSTAICVSNSGVGNTPNILKNSSRSSFAACISFTTERSANSSANAVKSLISSGQSDNNTDHQQLESSQE